jgi:hypothetical protein
VSAVDEQDLSITKQEIAENIVTVLLVRGEGPGGGSIYAYVAVRADRLDKFMDAQREDMFYPGDFGVIIEAGEGEPSAEIRHKMTTEYGFQHDAMVDVPDTEAARDIVENLTRDTDNE